MDYTSLIAIIVILALGFFALRVVSKALTLAVGLAAIVFVVAPGTYQEKLAWISAQSQAVIQEYGPSAVRTARESAEGLMTHVRKLIESAQKDRR